MVKCVHEWEVLTEQTLPSAFEQLGSEQVRSISGV